MQVDHLVERLDEKPGGDRGAILLSGLCRQGPHFVLQSFGPASRFSQVHLTGGRFHAHVDVVAQESADVGAIRFRQEIGAHPCLVNRIRFLYDEALSDIVAARGAVEGEGQHECKQRHCRSDHGSGYLGLSSGSKLMPSSQADTGLERNRDETNRR